MITTEEILKANIELAKGITQLAESVNQAVVILSKAILELENRGCLRDSTHQALQSLAETEVGK